MSIEYIKGKLFACLQFLVNYLNILLLKYHLWKGFLHYENNAVIYKVLFRYKPPERLDFSQKEDFICIIESISPPEILLKENISLYCITTTEAVLVDCGGEDVFNSRHHAFVYNAQFAIALKVITIPLKPFHNVVSDIELPAVPLLHLPNHGRCGSTLLTKVFEAIPGALSVSETNAFTCLAVLSQQGSVCYDELREMCYSVLMCTLKHCHSRRSALVFLKMQSNVTYITDVLMECIPQIKHVYMYRQPTAFVRSYEKLLFANNWKPLDEKMAIFWSGIGSSRILQGYPKYGEDYAEKLTSYSRFGLIWITGVAAYKSLIAKGFPIKALKFEDFLLDPRETVLSIFKYASIDPSNLPDVDAVMARDSQAGTEYSSQNVDKKKMEASLTPITDSLKQQLDVMCQEYDVPLFWSDVHLKNKI